MKSTGSIIAALLLTILAVSPDARAASLSQSAEQSPSEAKALLIAGGWQIQGSSWSHLRIFKADGTFNTPDNGETGKWKISSGMVLLIFSNGHTDKLILPINPAGTDGLDSKGGPMVAKQEAPAPGSASAPVSALDALKQNKPPVTSLTGATDSVAAAKTLLVQGQWSFQDESGTVVRVFRPNGTFYTVDHPGEGGTWKIEEGVVVLTMLSGQSRLTLPLDPKGTKGVDAKKKLITAVQEPLAAK